MKSKLLIILSTVALTIGYYNTRAFWPVVGSYPQRLEWLSNWPSSGYYAFNCSGLIMYAHGEDWVSERTLYAGDDGALQLIAEFKDKDRIRESVLQPGDIVVFQGPDAKGIGLHVVAYLGNGVWIDSDSRRGYVTKYHMSEKYLTDPWFSGHARAYRWRTESRVRFHPDFFQQEQENMGAN